MARLDGCLDTDDVIAFLDGGLKSADLARFEQHVARCDQCRKLLSLLARTDSMSWSTASRAPTWDSSPAPAGHDGMGVLPGAHVGRYVLGERLGGGAMGVVFAAHDPELDRNVAVKVLRSDIVVDPEHSSLEGRLLREAQAMAQLSHPNVVTVHDVGTFGDRIFIAMELVDGQTLAQWLAAERRALRDVVAMFIAAGRGLAAAHAAGLVHRDFKPENVLLGSDGRVRVTDFGLAHRAAMPVERTPASTGVDRTRTTTALLAGTPFYMAPEQLAGRTVDARSDQFSFCVALHVAMTGEHPFRVGGRSDGMLATRPRRTAMPSWLWRAVRPGLSVVREDRYPSMDDLLARLAIGPRRGRQIGLAAAAAAALALVTAGAASSRETRARGPTCGGAERLLAGVWDPQHARAIDDVFRASRLPDAATTFAFVSLRLDQYARRWIAMRTQACESAQRSDQAEAILTLRIACLDARLGELRELTSRLRAADAALIDGAAIEVQKLGTLDVCADDATLQRPLQADVAPRPGAMLALDAAGRLSYFVTDSEAMLWQIRTAPDGTVRDRIHVVDSVFGHPSLVVDADRRWQLFVRRGERSLWRGWQDGPDGSWHGQTLTYEVTDDPGVVLTGNRFVYFVRKADGWLWRYWQDAPSSTTWTGVRITDAVVGRPGVGLDIAGELHSFVRKADGSLWTARHVDPAQRPDHPIKLSDEVASDPVFSFDTANKMTYFVRRTDGFLMSGYQDVAGSPVWHRVLITDAVAGNPALAFDPDGKQICMMRKTDGSLWRGIQAVPAGGPWLESIVTEGVTGDPTVISDGERRTIYVVRKTDGSLWQGRHDPPGTSWHEHVLALSAGQSVSADPAQRP